MTKKSAILILLGSVSCVLPFPLTSFSEILALTSLLLSSHMQWAISLLTQTFEVALGCFEKHSQLLSTPQPSEKYINTSVLAKGYLFT